MNEQVSIAVIGSINLDIVATVAAFPRPGETVTNAVVQRFPGGKGANQALAAHRLGAKVFMIGRVGNDPAAEEALRTLQKEKVDTRYCQALENAFSFQRGIETLDDAIDQFAVLAQKYAGDDKHPVGQANEKRHLVNPVDMCRIRIRICTAGLQDQ